MGYKIVLELANSIKVFKIYLFHIFTQEKHNSKFIKDEFHSVDDISREIGTGPQLWHSFRPGIRASLIMIITKSDPLAHAT